MFDLDERVFTLCPIVQEKLQTELMHVSEQLINYKLLKVYYNLSWQKAKLRAPIHSS